MNANLSIPKNELKSFCETRHTKRLAIFGSALRDDFDAQSDTDVLVEFEQGHTPGFFELAEMERRLSDIFNGRKVDLRTPEDLSPYFRDNVLREAEVQIEF